MATFPSATELFNPGLTGAAANALVQQWYDTTKQLPGAQPPKTLVITNDAITPTQETCVVDTEGGAQADNLSVINTLELQDGALLTLRRADVNRIVNLIHSTAANGLRLYGGANKVLGVDESVTLRRVGNYWLEEVSQLSAAALLSGSAAQATANTAVQKADAAQATANTAVQKADAAQATANQALASVSPLEILFIGSPIYQPTATITPPANCMWPDGSLALFADWPQFAAKYHAGGFAGMVDDSSNGVNLGKFVRNSNGTGLYLPRHGGQFMRGWTPGFGVAGQWGRDEIRNITGAINDSSAILTKPAGAFSAYNTGTGYWVGTVNYADTDAFKFDASCVVNTGPENVPSHIRQPVAIYMGSHA